VADEPSLGQALERCGGVYAAIWQVHANENQMGGDKSIDDAFFEREVQLLELAFENQMHFGCFYAYVKVRCWAVRDNMCVQRVGSRSTSTAGSRLLSL
jgi:V-type H+-transporting ATPase subunit d